MQFYAVLRGNVLEFQKERPETEEYVEAEETATFANYAAYNPFPRWHQYRMSVKSVRFLDTISPVNASNWFYGFNRLQHFDKTNLDLSKATALNSMFEYCFGLKTLDLSGIDVSKVESLSVMFNCCPNLTSVNLTGWDTSNVKSFYGMFMNCISLEHMDLTAFSTASAESISHLFCQCTGLKSVQLPKFQNSQQILASNMFAGCTSLRDIDLSDFCIYHIRDMLNQCRTLSHIRVSAESLKCPGFLSKT